MTKNPVGSAPLERVVGPLAPNRGLHAERLQNDPLGLEVALAERWALECQGRHGVSGGRGVLDLLCSEADDIDIWLGLGHGHRKPLVELDDSHRTVAATVIQWLGTNVGRGFLEEAFSAAGYVLRYQKRPNVK
jgi:hypothetical protein